MDILRRVAVLITNTDRSDWTLSHPNDVEMVEASLRQSKRPWEVTGFDLPAGLFPSDPHEFDAYFIGGSPASVNDSLPWISDLFTFIRRLEELQLPAVGLCFGHQAIAAALGGRVERSIVGWQLGVTQMILCAQDEWMKPPSRSLHLYASHNEQVTALPRNAKVVGSSDGCAMAAITFGTNMISTQYHPEFSKDYMSGVVASLFERVLERKDPMIYIATQHTKLHLEINRILSMPKCNSFRIFSQTEFLESESKGPFVYSVYLMYSSYPTCSLMLRLLLTIPGGSIHIHSYMLKQPPITPLGVAGESPPGGNN